MADKTAVQCPLCGKSVPRGAKKCPVCATPLSETPPKAPIQRRVLRPPEDFLQREIPKVVLPEAKHTCPLCALQLQGRESKCPRCGVPLSIPQDEEMLECPQCRALAPFGSKSCPKCGVGFEEIPGPPPVEELPPPPEPMLPEPRPVRPAPPPPQTREVVRPVAPSAPPRQGFTNGRGAVNGTGFVNGRGAVNGTGFVNGRGAVNGTGLVNGTGMVNGTKGEAKLQARGKQRTLLVRWQFLAVLVALLIIIPTFVYLSYSQESTPFAVDGDFGEWSDVDKFGTYIQTSSAPISVSEWAVVSDDSRLFLYVRAVGAVMSTSEVSSFYLFVDSDNSDSTGYVVSRIGADYLLQLDGWNGSVQSTTLSVYQSTNEKYDWNSWNSAGSLSSLVSGNELEAMAELSVALGTSARYMLMTQNSQEQRALSYVVPEKGGLLAVEIQAGTGIGSGGVVVQSPSVSIVKLLLTCEGQSGTIQTIAPVVSGASLVSPVQDVTLEAGEEKTVEVLVDTSLSQAGSIVKVSLSVDDVDSTFEDVQVVGKEISAYIASAPSEIRIDGAFGDWQGRTTADVDFSLNPNDNIDIDAVGAVNDTAASSFYVRVKGEMCSGSYVPVIKEKPSGGGGGGVVIPTKKTGEDILKVYIDSDMNASTGHILTLSSKVIGADHLIEVRGINGEIVSKSLMAYSGSQWIYSSGVINAANDRQRLEVNVSSSSIGGASSIDFIVETTDWRLRTDLATAVPLGSRSIVGGLPSGAGTRSWHIESPTTSPSATAMSYQRKVFFDGINYWSFYFDGTNTVYKYSTDAGRTWTMVGQAFSAAGVDEASVWFDSTSNVVCIVGDVSSATTTIHVRRGLVTPLAHTIAWDASDITPAVSTIALGGKNTYVSRDRSGYFWLMSSNCTQSTPTRYDLTVFVSTSSDLLSPLAFRYSGGMLPGNVNQQNVKGSVVNFGTGSDMLAVYTYGGNVASKTLTTSWSAETIIYAIGAANPGNTDTAPPSVVVDSSGVAHVVYGNGHEQNPTSLPFIYYVYNRGAGWSVPYRLDSQKNNEGCFYPTISVDSSTGNVFAFWIATSSQIGRIIEAKKNVSGTWTSFSGTSDMTSPKQYLTSVYSVPSESALCWQWTQNTTGTIEVEFDVLPEFSDLVLPVLGMAAVFLFVYRSRSNRRNEDSSEE